KTHKGVEKKAKARARKKTGGAAKPEAAKAKKSKNELPGGEITVNKLIRHLAARLVDHPEGVHVDAHDAGETTVLTLRVAPGDLGKVIGREGRTAHAMRALLTAAASAQDRRAALEIAD